MFRQNTPYDNPNPSNAKADMKDSAPWDYQDLFSAKDIEFMLHIFGDMYKSEDALIKTLEKPIARYHLLGKEELFQALEESGSTASVSDYLYYCVQVTRALLEAGIKEHLMTESLSMSLTKVAKSIKGQSSALPSDRPKRIPLMIAVGMQPNAEASNKKDFQIIGDLEKACVVVEGTLTEHNKKVTSETTPPWPL